MQNLYRGETHMSKEDKVFEASVEMSFFFKANDFLEMRMVYMGIHTEQSFKYCLHHILEVLRKWCSCKVHTIKLTLLGYVVVDILF